MKVYIDDMLVKNATVEQHLEKLLAHFDAIE